MRHARDPRGVAGLSPQQALTEASSLRRLTTGRIATLTLDAPHSRNALSLAMMDALGSELRAIAGDAAIACVVIAAVGPVFCAGHDLREIAAARAGPDGGAVFFSTLMARCSALMQAIVELPQPVIAAVEGLATAAGCQLVAACDLAVAGEGAQFCTPGVDIGLFCSTPGVALARNASRKHAMEMLLTGARIDAETALRFGLVNRVAAAGGALPEALRFAGEIAGKSAQAIGFGKKAFYRQLGMALPEAYELAGRTMVENLLATDAKEGIAAFLEKRSPHWMGT